MPRIFPSKRLPFADALRRFKRDESGLAFLEFAIAAPVLIAIWLGTATFADLHTTSSRTSQIAATVSDIISQNPTVSLDRAAASFTIATALLGPDVAAKLDLYVAGIDIADDGKPTVRWSYGMGESVRPEPGSVYPIDGETNVSMSNNFIVTAVVRLEHTPLFTQIIGGNQQYEYAAYNMPRDGEPIIAVDNETGGMVPMPPVGTPNTSGGEPQDSNSTPPDPAPTDPSASGSDPESYDPVSAKEQAENARADYRDSNDTSPMITLPTGTEGSDPASAPTDPGTISGGDPMDLLRR